MGLDMYLGGHKFFAASQGSRPKEDGFEVEEHILALGRWRKHSNLHGYIVNRFAEGKDECQEIELNVYAMRQIIASIRDKPLLETSGSYFVAFDGIDGTESEDAETIAIFEKAIAWLEDDADKTIWRSIEYQAYW